MADSAIVLVTGSAGRLGQAAVRELMNRGHRVRGFDLAASPGVAEDRVGDLANASEVKQAVMGVQTIVHLAATPDDDDFLTRLLPSNIIGAYHVLEAAREAKVQRIILASSGQVVWWQRFRGPLPIGVDAEPTPRGWYAATKLFQEAAGRAYAEAHGLSVIAVRLGWCPRTREHVEELARTEWGPDVYLSPGDAGRFFACAVGAELKHRFAVVYACSRPKRRWTYDMEPAQRLLGFEPRDIWPQGVEQMLKREA